MKMLNRVIILAIIFSLTQPICAQAFDYTGVNFLINNPILTEGGSNSSQSANFVEKGSIGGPRATGKSGSANFTVRSGFQYYDETAPETDLAVINDGVGEDIDEQTSLNYLSANWTGFFDAESGLRLIQPYEYAVFRDSDNKYWNDSELIWQEDEFYKITSLEQVNIYPIYLDTGDTYFFKVRAHNNAKMMSSAIVSDGVSVIPSISFVLEGDEINLGTLGLDNNFTSDTASTTIKTTTNAYFGYSIKAWSLGAMAHKDYPSEFIDDFKGTNENPMSWDGDCSTDDSYCAFGYTTSDNNLSGGAPDRFTAGGAKYAGFTHFYSGAVVADHTDFITGQTGEVLDEEFNIRYKVMADENRISGEYSTTIIYVITPNF